jgi:hypothetical protein
MTRSGSFDVVRSQKDDGRGDRSGVQQSTDGLSMNAMLNGVSARIWFISLSLFAA